MTQSSGQGSSWRMLESDLRRAGLLPSNRSLSVWRALCLQRYRQARVCTLVRIATRGRGVWSIGARLLLRSLYGIELGSGVTIGRAVFFPHPMSIVIGQGVTIGDEVSVGQFVTLGGNYRRTQQRGDVIQRLPVVGSRVMIGPGAVIGGPVIVGDSVIVGANAVVTRDVPPNRVVYGQNQLGSRLVDVDISGAYRYLSSSEGPLQDGEKNGNRR